MRDVDSRVVVEALSSGSPFSDVIGDFEERPQQIEMAQAVAETINSGGRLMVEAGTGVGKSLAYLLPAALYATANDKRVVVSTNTINLQEQLIQKDLPMVKEAMRGFAPEAADAFRFTQLKGRANYLCYRRWRQMRSSADLDEAQARLMAKTLLWMPTTDTGDRSELNLGHRAAAAAWDRLSAQRAQGCPAPSGPCFLRAAREKAAASHIVVVNHALLISDLVAGGSAIPSYDILIIDEAHQLEEVATKQLGFEVSARDIDELVTELAGERGLLNRCGASVQRIDVAQSRRESVEEASSMASLLIPRLREAAAEMSLSISATLFPAKPRQSAFDPEKRITEDIRSSPSWRTVERSWENLDIVLGNLNRAISALVTAIDGIDSEGMSDVESLMSDLAAAGESIGTLRSQTGELVSNPSDESVYWVRQSARSSDVFLNAGAATCGAAFGGCFVLETEVCGGHERYAQRVGQLRAHYGALGTEGIAYPRAGVAFRFLRVGADSCAQRIPTPELGRIPTAGRVYRVRSSGGGRWADDGAVHVSRRAQSNVFGDPGGDVRARNPGSSSRHRRAAGAACVAVPGRTAVRAAGYVQLLGGSGFRG